MSTKIIRKVKDQIDDCLAVGLVDLSTGSLKELETTTTHPTEVFNLLSGATQEMFEGENIREIEKIFNRHRNLMADEKYFYEIIAISEHMLHYFVRLSNPSHVLVVVCKGKSHISFIKAKVKSVLASEGAIEVSDRVS